MLPTCRVMLHRAEYDSRRKRRRYLSDTNRTNSADLLCMRPTIYESVSRRSLARHDHRTCSHARTEATCICYCSRLAQLKPGTCLSVSRRMRVRHGSLRPTIRVPSIRACSDPGRRTEKVRRPISAYARFPASSFVRNARNATGVRETCVVGHTDAIIYAAFGA